MFRYLVGRLNRWLDRWLDALVGPSWREPRPHARCPLCHEDVVYNEPHLHERFVVRLTDWPEPGVMILVEPERRDAS